MLPEDIKTAFVEIFRLLITIEERGDMQPGAFKALMEKICNLVEVTIRNAKQ